MANSESYLLRIEELQEKYYQATLDEYQIQDYHPIEKEVNLESIQKAKKKKTDTANFELDMMYNKINNISNKLAYKRKGQVAQIEGQSLHQNLINDPDIFNIVSNEKEYKDWKQLTTEEKVEKANDFFQSTHYLEEGQEPYDEEIKIKLIEIINEEKLYLKKDIEYDKINQRIASIPLLKYQLDTQTWLIKSSENKKNMSKLSKNAVSKIMKKRT